MSATAGPRCSAAATATPLGPGSFTVVASTARTWNAPPGTTARPCSSNRRTHSACSQPLDFLSRFNSATSDRLARCACRARTAVSRNECPQPRCSRRVRRRLSTALSLRSPFNAPVSRASSRQSGGRNDSSTSQSSSTGPVSKSRIPHARIRQPRQENKLAPMGRAPRFGPAPRDARQLAGRSGTRSCGTVGVSTRLRASSAMLRPLRTPHHFARPWSAFVAHGLPAAVLRIPAPKPVASETRSGASS